MRGTPRLPGAGRRTLRFIPACAGNADLMGVIDQFPSVHPRVCGERNQRANLACDHAGSSPRVRGTLTNEETRFVLLRFIPACAGNASTVVVGIVGSSVHPRVCGEREGRELAANGEVGSSPRVRGTLLRSASAWGLRRFIPACAGNARTGSRGFIAPAVHPRVCGERSGGSRDTMGGSGSSPRVRGTQQTNGGFSDASRFIPACAGNAAPGKVLLGQ